MNLEWGRHALPDFFAHFAGRGGVRGASGALFELPHSPFHVERPQPPLCQDAPEYEGLVTAAPLLGAARPLPRPLPAGVVCATCPCACNTKITRDRDALACAGDLGCAIKLVLC